MKETFFSKLQAPMKKCAVPTKRPCSFAPQDH